MPPLNASRLPPPKDWQAFERLCRDLWSRLWDDPNAQLYGRGGQDQQGVDVFGRPGQGAEWAGVQCKLKGDLEDGRLTAAEIAAEVAKAEGFNPRLASYVIATTAPRDARAQEAARQLSREGLAVSVFAWDDLEQHLAKHPDLLAEHFPDFQLADAAAGASAREDYLRALWARLLPVPLLGVGSGGRREIPLTAVYTALDVTAEVHLQSERPGAEGPEGFGALFPRGDSTYLEGLLSRVRREEEAWRKRREEEPWAATESFRRRLTAVEAAAANRRLVLLGPAGSGKSTFARYLALALAGEALAHDEANLGWLDRAAADAVPEDRPWPHGAPLPVFLELRKLMRDAAFPAAPAPAGAEDLLACLGAGEEDASGYARLLRRELKKPDGVLLILDGLDETPAAETVREPLRQVISGFARGYPECRILVTSRPYAYTRERQDAWRLDDAGFDEAELAPFDKPQRRAYVEGWYGHLAGRRQVGEQQAERQARELVAEIEASPYLRPLAERPLMLTMMADLHAAGGGRFQGGRAELYEGSVRLLLDRWNEVRDIGEGTTASDELGLPVPEIRRALEELAYRVHRQRGSAGSEAVDVPAGELWELLDTTRRRLAIDGKVDERQVMDYLNQRCGILVGESPTVYRFPHRSYQEYLAACHLTRSRFPRQLLAAVARDPALWREVLLLAAGKVAETPYTAWALLGGLVPAPPEGAVARQDPRFLQALYAGLALRETGLWRGVEEVDAEKLERIRAWLERLVEVGALEPGDRAEGGRVLGLLGDRRPGVGLRADGVPDIDWLEVPVGEFVMGTGEHEYFGTPQVTLDLPVFRMARFPVTNAQYAAFVADGGYTERRRGCWPEPGWGWKGDRQGPDDELAATFLLPNHPRVKVSWYEASAFCGWLGSKLGHAVRLPSEAEWEKASRGPDGRAYPWGDDFDAGRCNVDATGIGTTSAVGSFPTGASPHGLLDMSGNAWEWCSTVWRESYEKPAVEDPDKKASRVVRGASFGLDLINFARCAARGSIDPRLADGNLGFRVVAPIL